MDTETNLRALALLGALALASCDEIGQVCTDIGCSSTLVALFLLDAPLTDGSYRVEVEGDSAVSFDVSGGVIDVPQDSLVEVEAVEGGIQATFTLGMETPDSVTLRLLADEEPLIEETASPTWGEVSYPNGEECDEQGCAEGEVTVGG